MRFGLIVNLRRQGAERAISQFLEWGEKTGHEIVLCEDLSEVSDDVVSEAVSMLPRDSLAHGVDVIVSMGGDGTFLASARAAGSVGTPLLGVNLGSLGFLTQLRPETLEETLNAIVDGDYQVEERMLLHCRVEGRPKLENPYALNDVVIDNGPIARLIDIKLWVNGEELVTYRADGLVLATPTGSTAYSLAVGGPIMQPRLKAIIAAPISSFSLSTRPIVFSQEDELELKIRSEHGVAGLTLDGQVTVPLIDTDRVIVSRSDFNLKVITFPHNSFYKVLKEKLHWGKTPTDH